MTSWTAIPDSQIDQDSPIIEILMDALRDNVAAGLEGATGAPVISTGWHPYDAVTVGDGADGEIYDFAVDGALATVDTPNFADGYEYAIFFEDISVTIGPILIQLYLTTTAAYLTIESVALSNVRIGTGLCRFTYPRLATRAHGLVWDVDMVDDANALVTSGHASGKNATAQITTNGRLTQTSGTFDAGKIYMYRRREYVTG